MFERLKNLFVPERYVQVKSIKNVNQLVLMARFTEGSISYAAPKSYSFPIKGGIVAIIAGNATVTVQNEGEYIAIMNNDKLTTILRDKKIKYTKIDIPSENFSAWRLLSHCGSTSGNDSDSLNTLIDQYENTFNDIKIKLDVKRHTKEYNAWKKTYEDKQRKSSLK